MTNNRCWAFSNTANIWSINFEHLMILRLISLFYSLPIFDQILVLDWRSFFCASFVWLYAWLNSEVKGELKWPTVKRRQFPPFLLERGTSPLYPFSRRSLGNRHYKPCWCAVNIHFLLKFVLGNNKFYTGWSLVSWTTRGQREIILYNQKNRQNQLT